MPTVPAAQLMNKRILGYFNWHRRRKTFHQRAVADLLVKDLATHNPDHVAVTGDLVNISLPCEFDTALAWLQTIGDSASVSVVPGNHDAYVKIPWKETLGKWAHFMGSCDKGVAHIMEAAPFPYVRIRGDTAIVGLSTGVPMPPFLASGKLGKQQISALRAALASLKADGYFRVLLIHHPPLAHQASWRKGLRDAAELAKVLRHDGAELILHGHNHRDMYETFTTQEGTAHIFGVPSASSGLRGYRPAAQYNLYDIKRCDGGWTCQVTVRGLAQDSQSFTTANEMTLTTTTNC